MSYHRRPQLEKQVDEDGWEIATNQKRAPAKKYYSTPKKAANKPAKTTAPVPAAPVEELVESVGQIDIKDEEEKVAPVVEEAAAPAVVEEQAKIGVIPLTEDDDDEDEGGEWITPDNVDEYKAAEIGVTADELKKKAVMAVGCMTADFAMQNVLLQMNLNLVSAGGYRVKKIRNSVMRCHACFW
jgi:RNA-binding protein NOB1